VASTLQFPLNCCCAATVPFVRVNAALTISDVEITRMTNLLCFLVLPYDPLLWIGELQAEQLCEPVSSVMIQNGSLQHQTSQMVRNALLHQSLPFEIAVVLAKSKVNPSCCRTRLLHRNQGSFHQPFALPQRVTGPA
jgi:hypothetical protein